MRWVGDGPPLAFIFAIFCSTHKVNRFKGLGEMNKQQLRETIFDVQKRKLTKVTITDFIQSDNTIVDINSLPKTTHLLQLLVLSEIWKSSSCHV